MDIIPVYILILTQLRKNETENAPEQKAREINKKKKQKIQQLRNKCNHLTYSLFFFPSTSTHNFVTTIGIEEEKKIYVGSPVQGIDF